MRIALFSDVHGNTPGLQAVLKAIDEEGGADVTVCAGDLLVGGPGHADVLDLLVERDVHMVRGNHEELYLDETAHIDKVGADQQDFIRRAHAYLDRHLSGGHRELLASLPLTLEFSLDGGPTLLVCHSAPASPWMDVCNPLATEMELAAHYGGTSAELIAHGHWHWHHVMRFGGKLLLNVASVGERTDGLSNLTILDTRPGGYTIRQLQIPYNTEEEERLMRIRQAPRMGG
jgi:predicted phosphodiesterase